MKDSGVNKAQVKDTKGEKKATGKDRVEKNDRRIKMDTSEYKVRRKRKRRRKERHDKRVG